MIFKRFHEGESRPTYLLGDRARGIAVLVDPRTDIDPYLDEAAACGLEIRHAISTGGSRPLLPLLELQSRVGAHIHRSASDPTLACVNPLLPGSAMTVGRLRFRIDPVNDALECFDLAEDSSEPLLVVEPRRVG